MEKPTYFHRGLSAFGKAVTKKQKIHFSTPQRGVWGKELWKTLWKMCKTRQNQASCRVALVWKKKKEAFFLSLGGGFFGTTLSKRGKKKFCRRLKNVAFARGARWWGASGAATLELRTGRRGADPYRHRALRYGRWRRGRLGGAFRDLMWAKGAAQKSVYKK